jgi:hypothetical protein
LRVPDFFFVAFFAPFPAVLFAGADAFFFLFLGICRTGLSVDSLAGIRSTSTTRSRPPGSDCMTFLCIRVESLATTSSRDFRIVALTLDGGAE